MATSTDRVKKSKLEKIYELQATNKGLKEENRNLRKELQTQRSGETSGSCREDQSLCSSNNEEKLMEAMKALKRVTIKQEMSLNTIRSKAEQRRKQVTLRDETISKQQNEIDNLRQAQAARKEADSDGDLGNLRANVEHLELRCAEQENSNTMLNLQLEASEEKARHLYKQLESARGLMKRHPSGRSLKSHDTSVSASEFDLLRMKKELATKIEKIVLLEFDLEMCMDEVHELKQKARHGAAGGAGIVEDPTAYQDEFFSDDEEEDEMW
jgi:hypothetical protein